MPSWVQGHDGFLQSEMFPWAGEAQNQGAGRSYTALLGSDDRREQGHVPKMKVGSTVCEPVAISQKGLFPDFSSFSKQ